MTTLTFQDFESTSDAGEFAMMAIRNHKASDSYRTAVLADKYDRQENVTINEYARMMYGLNVVEDVETGVRKAGVSMTEDRTASNNKLASNFFNRLNTQRVQYSMGAGLSYIQPDEQNTGKDETKEALGPDSDHVLTEAAYHACIHGVSFVFWNLDHLHEFPVTQFVPLYDERTGALRAGIRFWQLDSTHPMYVTIYREDGYSEWVQDDKGLAPLDMNGQRVSAEEVIGYKVQTSYVPADGVETVIGEEGYGGRLPIVPMWASRLKQSTLVGMKAHIDAYDLVKSGFANDLQDCAMVYWIVRNAGGMTDADLKEFRDRLKLEHIAKVDGIDGADAQPYTQEVPTAARTALLKELRDGIYEDFGALDVHAVAAGATNDHIDAAYQPMDENAADFEYWVGDSIRRLLALIGIDDSPVFQRQRISNQKEQVEMVVQEAQWLDQATVLRKLPNITPAEAQAVLVATEGEDAGRMGFGDISEESKSAE